MSDTIRQLRELLDKAGSTPWKWCPSLDLHMLPEIAFEDGDSVPWGGTEDEGHLFVAAVNALPALLAIAEAAKDIFPLARKLMEQIPDEVWDTGVIGPEGQREGDYWRMNVGDRISDACAALARLEDGK